jgi:DNA-binding MarR family transcriptional regulator
LSISPPPQPEQPGAAAASGRSTDLLFTFRITRLLDLLRRSGTLANRRAFDLSAIEWRVMSQVGGHAPLSLNQLAELVSLDRGQLSRTVKAMVERGLLDRKRKPGGPAIIITLSDEGTDLHARMITLARERNAFLIGGIAEDDLERAAEVIAAVSRNAQQLLERELACNPPGEPETDEE